MNIPIVLTLHTLSPTMLPRKLWGYDSKRNRVCCWCRAVDHLSKLLSSSQSSKIGTETDQCNLSAPTHSVQGASPGTIIHTLSLITQIWRQYSTAIFILIYPFIYSASVNSLFRVVVASKPNPGTLGNTGTEPVNCRVKGEHTLTHSFTPLVISQFTGMF